MRRQFALAVLLLAALPLFATEPNPSQRQRELVEKLLNIMEMDKTSKAMVDAMFAQIQTQYLTNAEANGTDADATAEAKELFESFRSEAAKIDFHGLMKESFIHIYSKYFTEQELDDLIAFYSTTTGRKTLEVLDDLMREGMQVGAEKLSPKIEEAMANAKAQHDKRRPWRRTMSDMREVAIALEAYAADNERYPTGDYDSLEETLEEYLEDEFPKKDVWGHGYAYAVSDDGQTFRLVSAGSDSIFEWDSRRVVASDAEPSFKYRNRLEDDIIFAGDQFIQLPVQAKPKE